MHVSQVLWNTLQVIFGAALVSAALSESGITFEWLLSYKLCQAMKERFLRFKSSVSLTIRDFRSNRFYIPWSRTQPVIIRSPDHMQALSESLDLSQRAVYADIFGFQYTMKHSDSGLAPDEQVAHQYRLFSRAIRIAGLKQIAVLYPYLQERLDISLSEVVGKVVSIQGSASVRLAPMVRDLAFDMMAVYFFGKDLAAEPKFSKALQRYYQDVITCSGALQVAPNFFAPLLHSILSRNGQALHVIFARLKLEISRIRNASEEPDGLGRITLFHSLVTLSNNLDYWTPDRLIQAVVGLWFAASHQPWINLHFIILELCRRPEYRNLLRQEIDAQGKMKYQDTSDLPRLDSFIKESVRLNPLDLMAIRRKALKPFLFPGGGPQLQSGQVACVSSYDIMHDPVKYPNPHEFDGLRFLKGPDQGSSSVDEPLRGTKLVDGSKDFPIWGFGSKICPGRWHGALVIKMVVVEVLRNFEFRLENDNQRTHFWWETFQMPYESTRVVFSKRPLM